MIRQLNLDGDHYSMGWQHGRQVLDLGSQISSAVDLRLSLLDKAGAELEPHLVELRQAWEETARPTLEMLRGIADALSLEWDAYFRYTVATYLMDRIHYPARGEQGCTVWAAARPVTSLGEPMLAKNRDYWPDHQDLQCLARAHPESGYRYTYLTSSGSPGVFSSGMNEVGLAVADTHVVSLDIGPGVPRYAVMQEVLEHHDRVGSALEYIHSVRHSGNGTIVLADAGGELAVAETGYSSIGVVLPQDGFVVSTNHYVSPPLHELCLDTSPEVLRGNSRMRRERVESALRASCGQVDLDWVEVMMSSHGGPLDSICRHAGLGERAITISSAIFLPQEKCLYLADGLPCQNAFTLIHL